MCFLIQPACSLHLEFPHLSSCCCLVLVQILLLLVLLLALAGQLVVSMRPFKCSDAQAVAAITAQYPRVHGRCVYHQWKAHGAAPKVPCQAFQSTVLDQGYIGPYGCLFWRSWVEFASIFENLSLLRVSLAWSINQFFPFPFWQSDSHWERRRDWCRRILS